MKQHFVTFFSPGTFVSEETTKPIDSCHVGQAVEMSKTILERYNAIPYGFQFTTRERGENDLDSKKTKQSPMYYLGGTVLTVADIEARNDPKDRILLSNMRCNRWERVIENTNSWKTVRPLMPEDVVLDMAAIPA